PTNRFTIGWRNNSTTNAFLPSLQFHGNIDEVSIYNYALSSNQVQNHYLSAGIIPRLTTVPTNTSVSEDTTATFKAGAIGSLPLSLQWYTSDSSNPQSALSGQTNGTLTLNNVTAGMNGNYYQFVASNSYGSITSPAVQLTVISGPPILELDLQSSISNYIGFPLVLSATFGGTAPISYRWYYNNNPLSDGGRISGSQSNVLTVADSQPGDAGTYQLVATNVQGSTPSTAAAVAIVPVLGFNGSGFGWSQQGTSVGSLYAGNNQLQLTFNTGNEDNSSFFDYPVYIGGFEASFLYQVVNPPGTPADGLCFVVQNDPRGAAALGGGGGALGVGGITPSAELEFNIYPNNPLGGVGIALATNGAIGNVIHTLPVNLISGDVIAVNILSLNGTVYLTLTDTNANATFSASAALNVPAVVGGNAAYVGFTGSDGGAEANQVINNFQFISLVPLSATPSNGNLVLTWPLGVGGYVLQQRSSLNSGSWANVPNAVTTVGGMNQVTVTAGAAQQFFQLVLP
ncbi:MAG TPA: immunoglobulin domain-containing protein, partial [Verrucomicrobiae bacterium]|nr:immunoglobulin domain-containing protein [Verrucomicrobiae bacterium]